MLAKKPLMLLLPHQNIIRRDSAAGMLPATSYVRHSSLQRTESSPLHRWAQWSPSGPDGLWINGFWFHAHYVFHSVSCYQGLLQGRAVKNWKLYKLMWSLINLHYYYFCPGGLREIDSIFLSLFLLWGVIRSHVMGSYPILVVFYNTNLKNRTALFLTLPSWLTI